MLIMSAIYGCIGVFALKLTHLNETKMIIVLCCGKRLTEACVFSLSLSLTAKIMNYTSSILVQNGNPSFGHIIKHMTLTFTLTNNTRHDASSAAGISVSSKELEVS